ncbi:MAG TPA: dihydrolipoamide acetyltransferase family protein [Aeromicrobium sp.]|nr:dihydrolipoamide acetyltransferase family protein [Aeromicrobium sp.]HKY58277.1 dihydrolipoamide acetyltransferase family protein [Aeromicrobium sp.]
MSEAEERPTRQEFALPDVGEGLTEAEIVTWRVAVGDTVQINDILLEIETAKSVVELPSPFAGVVDQLLADEGMTVSVGSPIIAIVDSRTAEASVAAGGQDSAPEREPTLVGYGARTSGPRRRRKVPTHVGTVVPLRSGHDEHVRHRVRVKPPVRKLAKDLGVDVNDVPTTGPVVTRADVEAYAASRRALSASESDVGEVGPAGMLPTERPGDVRVPVRGVHKAMASAMDRSLRVAPQATEWLTLDVSRTVDLLERLQAERSFAGIRLTPTVIVAKAVCLALRHSPALNSQWLETDTGDAELLVHDAVNLGFAVATERGLIVPNIKAADRLSLRELAGAIDRLTSTARDGRTQPADQAGGSFTITNIGTLGVDAGTPLLNPGESGILSMGAIQRRPWVLEDDSIGARWVTTLALTFDHRVVDGAGGSRFLTDVADILRDPATALTY